MTTPDPDPSATLAGIQDRLDDLDAIRLRRHIIAEESVNLKLHAITEDFCRLVAALEAVLALHQPGRVTIFGDLCKRHENHRYFSITRAEADDVEACPDCPASVYVSCAGCGPQVRLDSCPDREAITTALTGAHPGTQPRGGGDSG